MRVALARWRQPEQPSLRREQALRRLFIRYVQTTAGKRPALSATQFNNEELGT